MRVRPEALGSRFGATCGKQGWKCLRETGAQQDQLSREPQAQGQGGQDPGGKKLQIALS